MEDMENNNSNFVTTDELEAIVQKVVQSTLSKAIADLGSAQQRQFESFKQEIGSKIEESNSWIDEIIDEAESGGYDSDEDEEEEEDYEESGNNPEFMSVIEELKRKIEEERQARVEAEDRQRYSSLVSGAVEDLNKTGKVRNPHQLLRLLEADGYIEESENGFVATVKDEYGIKKTVPFAQAVDSFLTSDEFAHFAIARPGSGTGAEPGGVELPAPDISEKLLNPDNVKNASPEDFGKMLSQLDKAARGVR